MSRSPAPRRTSAERLRRFLSLLLTTVVVSGANTAVAGSVRQCDPLSFEQVREGTIVPLMAALAAGNVVEIQAHLSDEMASRYRTLLTRNGTYPDYLRAHFEDSSYQLRDVVTTSEGYTAVIEVYWADGRREIFELDLGDTNPHLPEKSAINECR